jgi:hypothetical protein
MTPALIGRGSSDLGAPHRRFPLAGAEVPHRGMCAFWHRRDVQSVRPAVMSPTYYRRAEHPVRRGNQPWNAYHHKQA